MDANAFGAVEQLESRRLLSSANAFNGLLVVHPDNNRANTISVENSVDQTSIVVSVTSVTQSGITKTLSKAFPKSDAIQTIRIFGSSRADVISAGVQNGALRASLDIQGRGGADTVTVGDDKATIRTTGGNSTIVAGDGADIVRVDSGNNSIRLGNGSDAVKLGRGRDTVTAGDGIDTVVGGSGADVITLGDGADSVFGGAGNDVIRTGDGSSAIYGGNGNDDIQAGDGNNTVQVIHGRNTITLGSGHNTFIFASPAVQKRQNTNIDLSKDTILYVTREPKPPTIHA